jgi:hypothetical protein
MRIFSDFQLFQRPPQPGRALFRWMAWRFLLFSAIFLCFVAYSAVTHVIGDEPLYFVDEDRYMTHAETLEVFWIFFLPSVAGFVIGLLGVLLVPKA